MKKSVQLSLLEKTIKELGYTLRYEKGNFFSGECRLREERLVIVNKFLPIEGKVYTLALLISDINPSELAPEITKTIDALIKNDLFSKKN